MLARDGGGECTGFLVLVGILALLYGAPNNPRHISGTFFPIPNGKGCAPLRGFAGKCIDIRFILPDVALLDVAIQETNGRRLRGGGHGGHAHSGGHAHGGGHGYAHQGRFASRRPIILRGVMTFYTLTIVSQSGLLRIVREDRRYIVDMPGVCVLTNESRIFVNVSFSSDVNDTIFVGIV